MSAQDRRLIQGKCLACGFVLPGHPQPRSVELLESETAFLSVISETEAVVPSSLKRFAKRRANALAQLECTCSHCGVVSTVPAISWQWDRRSTAALAFGLGAVLSPLCLVSVLLYLAVDLIATGILGAIMNWPILKHGRYFLLRSCCSACGEPALVALPDPLWRKSLCPACGGRGLRYDTPEKT